MTLPRIVLYISAVIIGLSLAFIVNASEYHHRNTTTTNIINTTGQSGAALSLGAAAIDCSYGTNKWQGGVGVGYYEDETAPAIGLCKKYDSGLYKFTIGNESGNTGASIGATFTFN